MRIVRDGKLLPEPVEGVPEVRVGNHGGDELNVIAPGVNYGWPVIGYGVNYRTGIPIHGSNQRRSGFRLLARPGS